MRHLIRITVNGEVHEVEVEARIVEAVKSMRRRMP
jgi:hypothetical protein